MAEEHEVLGSQSYMHNLFTHAHAKNARTHTHTQRP